MESLNNGFAPLAYHGRAMGYACDEPPRLYAQDPDFVDDFAHVNDEPDKIAQYDYSFAIVGEGSGSISSSHIPSTAGSFSQQYTDSPHQGFVRKEEEDDYDSYLFPDEFSGDKKQPVDDESDRSWSGSPGPAENDSVEGPLFVSDVVYSSIGLPSHAKTEDYLRQTLGIPLHKPVTLYSLPADPRGPNKPSITTLARLAIWGSSQRKLTLHQIFQAVEERYPSLGALSDKPHRRSIRHNLSLKGIFRREKRAQHAPGQGNYWFLDIRYGEQNKRRRRKEEGQPPEGTQATIVPHMFPSMAPSHQEASPSFLHDPVLLRRNYSNPEMMIQSLNNIHHSPAMLESLRDTYVDPHSSPVRPSYGSTIPYSEYSQAPEEVPAYFTQDAYQVNLTYSSGNANQQAQRTSYMQPVYVTERGRGRSGSSFPDPHHRQHIRQGVYVTNISRVGTHINDTGHRRRLPRRSYSDETFDRDVYADQRDAGRTPPTTRRTR